jgi:hypothetical protein
MYEEKYRVIQLKQMKMNLKIESGKVVQNLKPFDWSQGVF